MKKKTKSRKAKREFPQTWKHKKTGKVVRAMPWWEMLEDDTIVSDKNLPVKDKSVVKFKIGCLTQIGWLLENEHGVWLGVGPKAAESFEVMK